MQRDAIRAERHATADLEDAPNARADMEARGIVATWYLFSDKAKRPVFAHEFRGGRYAFVWGSRALFTRWTAQNMRA